MENDENGYIVFITSDQLGTGEKELGGMLMKAFLNTLWEAESRPDKIILMNNGVKLGVDGADALETLALLEREGVNILSCGTCLAYYRLTQKLKVGGVSNMREIVNVMLAAPKIIKI